MFGHLCMNTCLQKVPSNISFYELSIWDVSKGAFGELYKVPEPVSWTFALTNNKRNILLSRDVSVDTDPLLVVRYLPGFALYRKCLISRYSLRVPWLKTSVYIHVVLRNIQVSVMEKYWTQLTITHYYPSCYKYVIRTCMVVVESDE